MISPLTAHLINFTNFHLAAFKRLKNTNYSATKDTSHIFFLFKYTLRNFLLTNSLPFR